MGNLAIVAIPSENDYVYKISSEKVPHCTILFLGPEENANASRIIEFLAHAVNILEVGPFGLEVDYRGTLGPDEADVLFFKKDWCCKRIEQFRGNLLKNLDIRNAYDSITQYPEWTPHLTLGYPATPAHEDKRDFPGIRWVDFDRIALWTGDFEGPEFRLQYEWDKFSEVGMADLAKLGEEFLEHHGVKGMRWGHRSSSAAPTEVTTKSVVNRGLKSKTKVITKGGQAHPATEDAVKAAMHKQKLKKSGPAALSNKDLQELATRMNLEQQVRQLSVKEGLRGKKFVKDTLKDTGKQQTRQIFNAQAAKKVAKLGLAVA